VRLGDVLIDQMILREFSVAPLSSQLMTFVGNPGHFGVSGKSFLIASF
jgi:hypothetical protein